MFDQSTPAKHVPPSLLSLQTNNLWIDAGFNRSVISNYRVGDDDACRSQPFVLDSDLPEKLGGEDRGPAPPEYLLHALLACLTTTLSFHARNHGIEIGAIHSHAAGEIDTRGFSGSDPQTRIGFTAIEVDMDVQTDAGADQLRSFLNHSPVYDTLRRGTPISIAVTSL